MVDIGASAVGVSGSLPLVSTVTGAWVVVVASVV